MSNIVLVTGGARSGKSNFAELLCREQNNSTAYIATSVAFDVIGIAVNMSTTSKIDTSFFIRIMLFLFVCCFLK